MKGNPMDVPLFKLHLEEKGTLSDGSIRAYVGVAQRFLQSNPDLISLESYNNFLIRVAIKKRCYHSYSAIKAFINYKIEDANIRNKIFDNLIQPKLRNDFLQERKYLPKEKILKVINCLKESKHKVIGLIQMISGIRAGDVLRIKRGNIMTEDYDGEPTLKIAIIGKGNKRNVIYIHDTFAQTMIYDYITSHADTIEGYYFLEYSDAKGRTKAYLNIQDVITMNYNWFWADLKEALQSCGIDKHDWATHDFRRAFARRCWNKYKDVHILQGLLNHSNPTTTLRYLDQSGLKNIEYHKQMQTED